MGTFKPGAHGRQGLSSHQSYEPGQSCPGSFFCLKLEVARQAERSTRRGLTFPAPARSGRLLQVPFLIELVVKCLKANAEFFGRLRLVAAIAFDGLVDGLHLQIPQADRPRC